jgi:hypothetical protein
MMIIYKQLQLFTIQLQSITIYLQFIKTIYNSLKSIILYYNYITTALSLITIFSLKAVAVYTFFIGIANALKIVI